MRDIEDFAFACDEDIISETWAFASIRKYASFLILHSASH